MISSRIFFFNSLIGTSLIAAIALFHVAQVPQPYGLITVSIMAVSAIIFGERLEQTTLVRRVFRTSRIETEGWQKIAESVTAREVMIPTMAIIGCMVFDYVSLSALETAVIEKAQIIFLILTFAVVAYGIKQSGLFPICCFPRVGGLRWKHDQDDFVFIFAFVYFDICYFKRYRHSSYDSHNIRTLSSIANPQCAFATSWPICSRQYAFHGFVNRIAD